MLLLLAVSAMAFVLAPRAVGAVLTAVPGSPFATGSTPLSVGFSPNGRFVAVADALGNSISVYAIDPASGVLNQVSGSPFAVTGADPIPSSVAFSPDGAFLAVANQNANTVSVFAMDPTTGGLSQVAGSPFGPTGTAPFSVAFSPSGRLLATANFTTNNVSIFSVDPASGALTEATGSPAPAGTGTYDAEFSPDGGLLAVANFNSADVSVFAVGSAGTLAAVSGSPFPTASSPAKLQFSPGGQLLAVTAYGANGISMFSVTAGGVLASVPGSPFTTPSHPFQLVFSPDGRLLAAADYGADSVSAFTVGADGTLSAVRSSPFSTGSGSTPMGVAFSPDGTWLATANRGTDGVGVFRVSDRPSVTAISATQGQQFSGEVASDQCATPGAAATIDWGDGTAPPVSSVDASGSVSGAHIFASAGTFRGTVTITGGCGVASLTATVAAATATTVECSPASTVVGQQITCTVLVSGGAAAPTGTVALDSALPGSFSPSATCTIRGPATGSCTVTFTPSGPGSDAVSADYAGDVTHAASTGSTSVSVLPVGVPVCRDVGVSTPEGGGSVSVVLSCSGPVGTAVRYAVVGAPAHGEVGTVDPVAGLVSYTSRAGFVGSDAFTYEGVGPGGVSAPATVTVSVPGAPVPGGVVLAVSCAPRVLTAGGQALCTVTVTDSSGAAVPTGEVSLSSATGHFAAGGRCELRATGMASAACSAALTATGTGTITVTAGWSGSDATSSTTVAAAPVAGKSAAVSVASGSVYVEVGGRFVALKGTESVPAGSTIDARKGAVTITTALDGLPASDRRHRAQTGTFSAGIFTIKQAAARRRSRRTIPTDVLLQTPPHGVARARCTRTGPPRKGVVRMLQGVVKGVYRALGAASTTSITRGTFTVQDRCDGTLTSVKRGHATVQISKGPRRGRSVHLTAGQSILTRVRLFAAKQQAARHLRAALSL